MKDENGNYYYGKCIFSYSTQIEEAFNSGKKCLIVLISENKGRARNIYPYRAKYVIKG